MKPTSGDVASAAARIGPWIRDTPLIEIQGPGARAVHLKLEGMQRSGSFKLRGALNKVLCLGSQAARGVVTASGGNHGLGLAWAGWLLGRPVHVCVPARIPASKLARLRDAAATVELVDGAYPHAEIAARSYARAKGLPYIHAHDDADVIAGQGTLISEILDARPDIATLVVAVGGGGLAAGAILAARGRRIIGVEPLGAPTLYEALAVGAPVRVEVESVAADALGAGEVGALPLALCAGKIHRVELIHDSAIIEAQRWLWAHLRLLVEPGAAITLAALAEGRFDADPGPIALVLGGANVDPCFLDL